MKQGDSCYYIIEASQGGPIFYISNKTNVNNSKVLVNYIEYSWSFVNMTTGLIPGNFDTSAN